MVMDLSTGDDLDRVRREILRRCPVILGTVPIYQAVADRGSVYDDGGRPVRGDREARPGTAWTS